MSSVRSILCNLLTAPLVVAIRAYQVGVRPFLLGNCKFHPTCSEYAIEALKLHGPLRGGLLALRRIARCHPFTRGGIDLVPERSGGTSGAHQQPLRIG